jgi:hypothetical protein
VCPPTPPSSARPATALRGRPQAEPIPVSEAGRGGGSSSTDGPPAWTGDRRVLQAACVPTATELLRKGRPWASPLREGAVALPARQLGRRVAVVGGAGGVHPAGLVDLDTLVPEGGDDVATGHRSPGEGSRSRCWPSRCGLGHTPHTLPPQDRG